MDSEKIIDLRSDTVTQPTPGMLEAMMQARVGDDVFSEDPTVLKLQEKAAEIFGMETAIFCPSGTMTNQIAIKILTQPLNEVICDRQAHIYNYEGGGIAFNSGASVRLLHGDRGRFTAKDVLENINPDDIHDPITSLVALENTCNRAGGSCYDFKEIKAIQKVCKENNLKLHLDGARLFNAITQTGDDPKEYGKVFDTISVCLSKGLGAPVGSLLISSKENIKKAQRVRKVFGGGMRQAGFLAAAGIYALYNHIERLKEDHRRAKELESVLKSVSYVESIMPVETNIIYFTLNEKYTGQQFIQKLSESNILAFEVAKNVIRFVTHLDFDDEKLTRTVEVLKKL